jgi:hypothetical protein
MVGHEFRVEVTISIVKVPRTVLSALRNKMLERLTDSWVFAVTQSRDEVRPNLNVIVKMPRITKPVSFLVSFSLVD